MAIHEECVVFWVYFKSLPTLQKLLITGYMPFNIVGRKAQESS